jgi:hypothetical protein
MPPAHRTLAALALVACAVASGCGGSGGSSKAQYSGADIKAAYYKAKDAGAGAQFDDYWVDADFHSHSNYVPIGGLETCPLAQRSDGPSSGSGAPNQVEPTAAEPVQQFVVEPHDVTDVQMPTVTQGAFVFGTGTIADNGMRTVTAAATRCPTSYDVRGGPSPILGTYSVSSRPFEVAGWKGLIQQIAHTNPADQVYYEDAVHVILHRANVIFYLDVDQKRVIGQRSDSAGKAASILGTVLKRLR